MWNNDSLISPTKDKDSDNRSDLMKKIMVTTEKFRELTDELDKLKDIQGVTLTPDLDMAYCTLDSTYQDFAFKFYYIKHQDNANHLL